MTQRALTLILLGLLAGGAAPATPAPTHLGQCVRARIASLSQRLIDGRTATPIRGSGSVVRFSNLVAQVSYDQVGAIQRSRVGDPVEICLVQLPSDCPAGDDRGKIYRTTNLRTKSTWTLPDSEHSCGGA